MKSTLSTAVWICVIGWSAIILVGLAFGVLFSSCNAVLDYTNRHPIVSRK